MFSACDRSIRPLGEYPHHHSPLYKGDDKLFQQAYTGLVCVWFHLYHLRHVRIHPCERYSKYNIRKATVRLSNCLFVSQFVYNLFHKKSWIKVVFNINIMYNLKIVKPTKPNKNFIEDFVYWKWKLQDIFTVWSWPVTEDSLVYVIIFPKVRECW